MMRLIDADACVEDYIEVAEVEWPGAGTMLVMAVDDLQYLPVIDPVHAVGGCYFRECIHFRPNKYAETKWDGKASCDSVYGLTEPNEDDFCSYGEKEAINGNLN